MLSWMTLRWSVGPNELAQISRSIALFTVRGCAKPKHRLLLEFGQKHQKYVLGTLPLAETAHNQSASHHFRSMGAEIDTEDNNITIVAEPFSQAPQSDPYCVDDAPPPKEEPISILEVVEEIAESRWCGLWQFHCHYWALALFCLLYIAIVGFVLIGVYAEVKKSWEQRQTVCYSELVNSTCYLNQFVAPPALQYTSFYWVAHPVSQPNNTVHLYPDCRYLIKENYSGTPSQMYGLSLIANTTAPCFIPKDALSSHNSTYNGDGTLSYKVWESNTGKIGLGVSIGLAVGCLICFGVCWIASSAISKEFKDDCYVKRKDEAGFDRVCLYPTSVYCSLNPVHCLLNLLPVAFLVKIVINICIVIILAVVIIIYALPSNTRNGRYY
ncbi:hypothetical protein PROFUN_03087 [Planoprotostelium fungivorum]|uniref:Uncharacterized protein n=1 Tax=Planoprotostelium fungivorum TaxID=1890364 RepID=A0A2P6NQ71_9EUKA|nr:hypothetical protein PROFUN_03087 [Planoprotostelium fungivorum]